MRDYKNLTDNMNIAQKCAFITGESTETLPEIKFADSAEYSVAISPVVLARTWNTSLIEKTARNAGAAAHSSGVNVLRAPLSLSGETAGFSEDPYLAGKVSAAYVRGVQQGGVAACLIDYPMNNGGANEILTDERSLREIHMTPTELAIREGGAKCVEINSFNLNGLNSRRCSKFVTGVLRKEWGFGGAAVCHSNNYKMACGAISAGIDSVLPNSGTKISGGIEKAVNAFIARSPNANDKNAKRELVYAIKVGEVVNPAALNASAERLADLCLNSRADVTTAHNADISQAAAESLVLLKNSGNTLPLGAHAKVAIVGASEIVNAFGKKEKSYNERIVGTSGGFDSDSISNASMLAARADAVVAFVGVDVRRGMCLPKGQRSLLEALRATGKKVIAAVTLDNIEDIDWSAYCDAVMLSCGTSEVAINSFMSAIFGKINPSGKLAESIPKAPQLRITEKKGGVHRTNGIFVGYRYAAPNASEKYPFGFGLSYTSFQYSDLTLSDSGAQVLVKNTGNVDGAEVVQMYVGMPSSSVIRPKKELKGFAKVCIKAGETVRVDIPFDNMTFRYFDAKTAKWEIENGEYEITVGSSSEDCALSCIKKISGTTMGTPYPKSRVPSYAAGKVEKVRRKEHENLLAFESGNDIIAEKRILLRKKIIVALVIAALIAVIDLSITLSGLVRLNYAYHFAVFVAANLSVIVVFALIITMAGSVSYLSRSSEYILPECKENNAYMLYPDIAHAYVPNVNTEDTGMTIAQPNQDSYEETETETFTMAATDNFIHLPSESFQFDGLCREFIMFATENGLTAGVAEVRNIFAAMAGARLVVLRSGKPEAAKRLADTLCAFFGGSGGAVSMKNVTTSAQLVSSLFAHSANNANAISVYTVSDLTLGKLDCMDSIMPFIKTPIRQCKVSGDSGSFVLSGGMWFFAIAEAGENKPLSLGIAEYAATADVSAVIAAGSDKIAYSGRTISFASWQTALMDSKAIRYVREELWKKLDKLEEWANGKAAFEISNKQFRQAEDFTSVYMSCGGEDTDALDAVISSKIIPVLAAYQGSPFSDGEDGLNDALGRIFGEDNAVMSRAACARLGVN